MRRRARLLGAWAVLIGGSSIALASPTPMRFTHLTMDDGLSQSAVLSVFQDRRGFMWFGTENGLNRFDGHDFRIFTQDRLDQHSISGNYVWGIDEDESGDLWLATVGAGVSRRDASTGQFRSYRHDAETETTLASDRVRTLHVGLDGAIWVGTLDAGLDRLDPVTGTAKHYRHDPANPSSLANDSVYAIYPDGLGHLWIATDGGLDRLDIESGIFTHFAHDPSDASSLSHNEVRAIVQDRAGALWVGTWGGGVNILDRGATAFRHYRHDPEDATSLSNDQVQTLLEDATGRLLIGTSSGLNFWSRGEGGFDRYIHDPAQGHSLGGDHIMTIFQDRGGVVWFGTRFSGVDRWNPATWSFGHVAADPSDPLALSNPNVTSFSEDRAGRLWLGTFGGGVSILDRVSGTMEHLRHDPNRGGTLSTDRVMALTHDHFGALWIGTMGGGLNHLAPGRERVEVYRNDPLRSDSLSSDAIMTVFEDRAGTMWIGTFGGGLNRLDRSTATFTRFANDPEDSESLGSQRVTSLADGPGDWLWVGTEGGGLNALDRRGGSFQHFLHDPENPETLSSDIVYSLHVDSSQTLWIGTRGGGLSRATGAPDSPEAMTFTTYLMSDGLPDNDVYGIRSGSDGNLWLSTNRGLARFDPRTETFTNFDASQGLQADEFHFGSHFDSTSGELFFGGVNGFNAFFPERLVRNENAPPVELTAFLKLNQPQALRGASGSGPIDLDYRDDVVTFEFAALDFAAPQRNRYAYRLEGFDPDWVDIGDVRRVTYTDLDGGDYVFRVKAANSDGVWNETGLAVDITVAAPPWLTPWAYAGYLLAAIVAAASFARFQRSKLRREEEYSHKLEEEVQARTRELDERAAELEELNEKLVEASLTDALTGMPNRRFLFEWIDRELPLLQRQFEDLDAGGVTADTFDLVFLMIDLDNFKSVNDTCGHLAGDQVLQEVRAILAETCRGPDLMIRWGGDEFLVVGRGSTPEGVASLAERIRARIEDHAFVLSQGQVVRVTCSIGVACYPFQRTNLTALSWDQVVNVADVALYTAKRSGRNAWVGLFSNPDTDGAGLLRRLREAPTDLVADGGVGVQSSISDEQELHWQPFQPRASTKPLEVPEESTPKTNS